ncbi:sterol desaturase family protein [Cytophagaceae bacterium DM2B3-1]|uniref:Sterol desaturase family protein n=1 Tax=Xanthocytophaga flava TaxID=3048013 RepID=A0ABT7CCF5_9BACT|nr:sterol desaturase family protein [Xanthocytophaga flavus]MDJ1491313.1 sterol desaturase family protein [Xanthocytophaga flavus]
METNQQTTPKPKNSGRKQLFENPVLERLTRTHISIPISIFVLFSIGLLTYAFTMAQLPYLVIGVLFFSGLILFTLVEYLMHRYVFHMSTHTTTRAKLQYTMHGVHHEYPKDKERLAMPPIISITIATLLLGITYLIMNKYAFAFLPGFVLGYAGYLFVHYITHAYAPPKNKFRQLWIHHSMHHYKDGHKAFGVSSPLWDYIFGTMP